MPTISPSVSAECDLSSSPPTSTSTPTTPPADATAGGPPHPSNYVPLVPLVTSKTSSQTKLNGRVPWFRQLAASTVRKNGLLPIYAYKYDDTLPI